VRLVQEIVERADETLVAEPVEYLALGTAHERISREVRFTIGARTLRSSYKSFYDNDFPGGDPAAKQTYYTIRFGRPERRCRWNRGLR
jgi:hypothetical protein